MLPGKLHLCWINDTAALRKKSCLRNWNRESKRTFWMSHVPVRPVLHYGRTFLVHLALTCVVLRALLPVGFMADFGAAAKGEFKVVICSAYGPKTIDLDLGPGPAHDPNSQAAQGDLCPFGMSPAAAPLPEPLAIAIRYERTRDAAAAPAALVLVPFSTGPPVGSRAPPAQHPSA